MAIFSSIQTFPFPLFTCIVSMILIIVIWISFRPKTKKKLPPSPRKLPIIGNFHQVGSNMSYSLQSLTQKHGPIILLHLGSVPTLVVSSAKVAQEIMKTHDLSFSSRPSSNITHILTFGSKDIGLSPYMEYGRHLKRIVATHLLSNTRVKSFQQVREEEVNLMINMLRESSGSLVDMRSLLSSLSNNIISRVAIGRTHDSKLIDLLTRLVELFGVLSVGTYIPWLWWIDRLTGLEERSKQVAKELDEFLEGVIKEHVNKRKGLLPSQDSDSKDLVDILLEVQKENTVDFTLQKDNIKALILNMFSGGTDTTSTSLEWTISELIKNPIIMKRLQQEVTEIGKGRFMIQEKDLEEMHYLKAVIKESLRLHPPLPFLLPRQATQDVKLMGYDVPRGTQVIINGWVIGRDPAGWEEPNEFKPERFLNNSIDYKGFNSYWLPFGAGRRGCPGIQFGVVSMELALANIVYKFNFSLENGTECGNLDMAEVMGITLKKKSSLMVLASPRC